MTSSNGVEGSPPSVPAQQAAPAAPVAAASAAAAATDAGRREPTATTTIGPNGNSGNDGAATADGARPTRRERPPRSVTQYTYTVRERPAEVQRILDAHQHGRGPQPYHAHPPSVDEMAQRARQPPPPPPVYREHAQKKEAALQTNTAVGAFTVLTMGVVVMLIGAAMGSDLLLLKGSQSAKLTVTDSRQRVTFWGVERCQMIGLRVDYCESHSLGKALELDEVSRHCPSFVRGAAGCITIALLLCLVVAALAIAEWARKFHDIVAGSEGWTRFVRCLVTVFACVFTILPVFVMDRALNTNSCFDLQVVPAEEYEPGPARTLCILALVFALCPIIAEIMRVCDMCPGAPDIAWQLKMERKAARRYLDEAKQSQERHRKIVAHVIAPPQPPAATAAATVQADGDNGGPTMATVIDGTRAAVGPTTPRSNDGTDDDDDDAPVTHTTPATADGEAEADAVVVLPAALLIPDEEVCTDTVSAGVRAEAVLVLTCSAFIGMIAIACLASRVDVHKGGTLRIGRFIDPNPNDYQLYFFSTTECAPNVGCELRTLEHVTSKECSRSTRATAAMLSIAIISFAVAFICAARTASGASKWAHANRLATPWALITACAALYAAFGILEGASARMYCLPFFLHHSRDGPAWPCLVTCLVLTPMLCLFTAVPKLVRVQWLAYSKAADYRAQRKAEYRAAQAARLAAKEAEMAVKTRRKKKGGVAPLDGRGGEDEPSVAVAAAAGEGDAMLADDDSCHFHAQSDSEPPVDNGASSREPLVVGAVDDEDAGGGVREPSLPPGCANMSPSAASDAGATYMEGDASHCTAGPSEPSSVHAPV